MFTIICRNRQGFFSFLLPLDFFKKENYFQKSFLILPPTGFCNLWLNPIQAGPPELTIQAGGGQKRLRYIIGPYLSDFKSDFIRVKSKSELHIIRSHLEKKIAKTFKIGRVIVVFVCHSKIQKKIEIFFFNLKSLFLGQFSKYWGLVFCKHPQFYSKTGF